ncbi:G protein-coupled receptor [Operophtera brumata]|uniref:G protein-coupled receptor n=1 Tax=Operophtera brumata TaxID=104452 RepID=A0A0L7L621_OPEBR|nr:G protein-coupled receptor [Operophtera brumata]
MGLNWILEVVSFLVPGFRMWYLTDAYNILIGVSIFLIFVCKRKIMRKLTKLYIRHSKSQWYPGNSTRSNTSSSENSQETQTLQMCANPKGPGYNASLYRVLPNSYGCLTKIDSSHFCVDFYMSESNGIKFAFWITPESDTGSKHNKSEYFQNAAMFISCFFLLLVLIVYALLAELRNLGGLILIAYVVSLFFALLFLAIIRIQQHSENMCYGLRKIVSNPSTNIKGLILPRPSLNEKARIMDKKNINNAPKYVLPCRGYAKARPIHRRGESIKYMMYSIYAWGVPLALTIMLVSINASDLSDKPWVIKPFHMNLGCFIEEHNRLLLRKQLDMSLTNIKKRTKQGTLQYTAGDGNPANNCPVLVFEETY